MNKDKGKSNIAAQLVEDTMSVNEIVAKDIATILREQNDLIELTVNIAKQQAELKAMQDGVAARSKDLTDQIRTFIPRLRAAKDNAITAKVTEITSPNKGNFENERSFLTYFDQTKKVFVQDYDTVVNARLQNVNNDAKTRAWFCGLGDGLSCHALDRVVASTIRQRIPYFEVIDKMNLSPEEANRFILAVTQKQAEAETVAATIQSVATNKDLKTAKEEKVKIPSKEEIKTPGKKGWF